jgi:hypothetical protein
MTEQLSLPWSAAAETCSRCHGAGNVYYVRQANPDVEVVGGKRIVCPVCGGSGSVSVPVQAGRALVTTRPPKRRPKPAQAATIKVPRIVQHTPKGRAWKSPPDDPEAKARAAAFFERMGIKRAAPR